MGEHLPKNLLNGPNQKKIPVNVDSWLNHSESIKARVHIVFLTAACVLRSPGMKRLCVERKRKRCTLVLTVSCCQHEDNRGLTTQLTMS